MFDVDTPRETATVIPDLLPAQVLQVRGPEDVGLPHWNYLAEHESAAISVTKPQLAGLLVLLVLAVLTFFIDPLLIGASAIAGAMALYVISMMYKTATTARGANGLTVVSDKEARSISDAALPVVTILLPAFKEYRTVLQHLTEALDRMEYPKDRLDIKFLIEECDELTLRYLYSLQLPRYYEIVVTSKFGPQTKPKACNIGLARAVGEITVIYDVEDDPDPLQLRKVVFAFRDLNSRLTSPKGKVAAIQCMLQYRNAYEPAEPFFWRRPRNAASNRPAGYGEWAIGIRDQIWERVNPLVKLMDIEYLSYFRQIIGGLATARHPVVPLGGTSNFFLTDELRRLGAWDAFNVTEDQELGIRYACHGYRVVALDSVTLEKAEDSWANWFKQRRRWEKGKFQTYAVKMRHPITVARQLGPRGFLQFQLVIGLPLLLLLLNPVFWSLSILYGLSMPGVFSLLVPDWHLPLLGSLEDVLEPLRYVVNDTIYRMYRQPALYMGNLCMWLGNALFLLYMVVAAIRHGKPGTSMWTLFMPFYWFALSWVTLRAFVEFFVDPHSWSKSEHKPQGDDLIHLISPETPAQQMQSLG